MNPADLQKLITELQAELQWMRYPLPIWAVFSLSTWIFAPAHFIQTITSWVCGVLLVGAAGCLWLLWKEIQSHHVADGLKRELRQVATAVVVTGVTGVGCWVVLPVTLSGNPSLALCATAWALCSAGFVLSLLITHLVLAFLLHIEQRRFEHRSEA